MARNKIPDIRAQTLPEHGMAGCAVSAACRITTCHTRMCSWAQVQPNFSLHAQQTMHTHVALRRAAGARAAYMRGRRDCAQASADRDVRVQHRRGPHQNRELINSADSRMLDRSSPYLTHQRIECKTRTQEENYGGSIFLSSNTHPYGCVFDTRTRTRPTFWAVT